ncbi:hypothetical protein DAPPUDRAFT_119338 [Daphnia pulex]|uniref:Uncharacterized protein n=1 Tax=Daphnia pulex TaxID=6669 RepID=E9HY87_DAPPU|nr:hypothetical protein DAPPUDRAFT_119338 [Daphnia pulex]|eukprot:EFX63293.1 hypothetical protein DAPPUDRAFT_119338 [Daphnia pulex]
MKEEEVPRVKDITKHYQLLLSELCLDYNSLCRVRKFQLYEKLISYFGDKVKEEVTFLLRNLILERPRNILPKNLNIEELIAGESKPPNLLRTFFESLVAVYCHLDIPIQVSRLIKTKLQFRRRFRNRASFGAVEESKLLPESLHRRPDLNTGVVFDNFDLSLETLTGKDTLHETVGIATQDVPPDGDNFLQLAKSEDNECDIILQTGKRRREFIPECCLSPCWLKQTVGDHFH